MVKTALKNSTKRKQNDKLYNFFLAIILNFIFWLISDLILP